MAKLEDLLIYLLQHYPYKEELSNARLTKLVYLCDWKSSIDYRRQITGIQWQYDNFGPFVWDILSCAKRNPDIFQIESTTNPFGTSKLLLSLTGLYLEPALTENERMVADHVIKTTQNKSFSEFIQLVYSTFPIVNSERFSKLDLIKLAKEYKDSSVYKRVAVQ